LPVSPGLFMNACTATADTPLHRVVSPLCRRQALRLLGMERSIAEKVIGFSGLHEFYNDRRNMAEG
jgi:hypothetical protein